MSWISRSLTGVLKDKEDKEEKDESGAEFWDDPELFEPGQSVGEDLAELRKSLTQSLWGVASFLAPPPKLPRENSPKVEEETSRDDYQANQGVENASVGIVEKEKLSGMQSDFAELKGGFAKGLSRLSSVIRGDESRSSDKPEGASQDHGIAGLLKPLIDNVLSSDKPAGQVTPVDDEEDTSRGGGVESSSKMGISAATLVDGVSKLASSLFLFDDEPDDAIEVPGLTDEVVAFARNVSLHPETWLDFPLASDDDLQNGFEMNSFQKDHAYAVERAALRLAALKVEICPRHMNEGRFWKIYFVLVHPRLSQEDAALLSTPQVLEARKILLEQLRHEEEVQATTATAIKADDSLVVDKDAIPSTVKLAAAKSSEENEADEWLDEEATGSNAGNTNKEISAAGNDEDDVSFSDLEDDHDDGRIQRAAKAQGWVELDTKAKSEEEIDEECAKKHERMGSNDWLTVDKEDAGNSV
ncbi:hypothetical protein SELMODRAFT_152998 [Selaginella moellendorffii]|uniref:BSD domain-containing protein n=1 Tax=Selaginella moellendorffii TaxID=88036 RepID=D8S6Z3_SELML|nr:uncharacterized protein LOC9659836 [Selaginella moellendorffii]EFJ19895.1 hypothetical protein SELMODRAFT_152998 [Selaginella moellendorffii]|eukprot:XP_002978938.1 uncharacterized protein LOC9659836 [Selaginella moellendorffii]